MRPEGTLECWDFGCCRGSLSSKWRELPLQDLNNILSLQNVEEIQMWCRERNISNVVLIKDSEAGFVRLKSWEKDR